MGTAFVIVAILTALLGIGFLSALAVMVSAGNESANATQVPDHDHDDPDGELDPLPSEVIGWYGNAGLTVSQRSTTAPAGANMYCGFYGFSDAETQLANSGQPWPGVSSMFVCGGAGGTQPNVVDEGFDPGYMSPAALATYTVEFFQKIRALGWVGFLLDAEEGGAGAGGVDLTPADFNDLFARAVEGGMEYTGVTTSHVAPYGFPPLELNGEPASTVAWCEVWTQDPNVQFFSPQLYTFGDVLDPSLLAGAEVRQQAMLDNSIAKIVPSIPTPADYTTVLADPVWEDSQGYIIWYDFPGATG